MLIYVKPHLYVVQDTRRVSIQAKWYLYFMSTKFKNHDVLWYSKKIFNLVCVAGHSSYSSPLKEI